MLERKLEGYFRDQVKAAGGWAIKFVPKYISGFPDRFVLWKGARVDFVELKRPGVRFGKRIGEKLQKLVHEKLKGFGFKVLIIDSKVKVDEYTKSRGV